MNEQPRVDDLAERLGLNKPKNPRSRRRLLLIGGGTAVLLLVLGYWAFRSPPVHYLALPVTRGGLTVTVSATGTLKPLNQVDVGAEISGRIIALNADFNDHVTAGEVLAQLDTDELKARVVQSEGSVANAEATVVETRAKRDRIAALRRTGTSSTEDLDVAQAAFDRAQAAVKQSHALLDVDRKNLSRAQILSPIDGIVLDRKVEAGQTVAATFQTPVLFTLAEDLKRMRLLVDVDEADVGRVHEGEDASFTVDAYSGRRFAAKVCQLRNSPQSNEGVVTYPLELIVDNPDLALKPGMTANAEIIAAKPTNALLIPNGALRFTPPSYALTREDGADPPRVKALHLKRGETGPPLPDFGAGYGVAWTKDGSTPVPHLIKLGPSDGAHSVIEGGDLNVGDEVLIDIERKPETGSAQ